MEQKVLNLTRNHLLVTRLYEARTFGQRLRGLIGRAPLKPGEGLLIEPCRAVHTCFLSHPIDVLFYDGEKRVVALFPSLLPWRFTPFIGRAQGVLELPSGILEVSGTQIGDELGFEQD
ncbi:DUF192 domain-containing protein [Ammonifex thiophilus]|uniref:DUF192 domain-containing protein n=1 Tax=Ammonifex thiophilus TaxID=444093 RepID=A0A3D8P745_9THEO|nr:DUF192 domain-containing protein [Ammonifex thiophilus]RDV84058.1 DUF192 domain-containing protein [Ammonifex thiophilus]